jgi:hypothetical protein
MFTRYNQAAIVITFNVSIVFRDEGVATRLANDLVSCRDAGLEYVRRVADGLCCGFVPSDRGRTPRP